MVLWIAVIIVTAVACAALYYAARARPVNAAGALIPDLTTEHFRQRLRELDTDIGAGRLGEAEAVAARGEIARELLHAQKEQPARGRAARARSLLLPLSVAAVAVIALGAYGLLGSPQLPAQPLLARTDLPPAPIDLDDAIVRIETQLAETPDDLRGWTVIAPVYMQLGRFADAATAYRRIIELGGANAESETDLGEALMMVNGGTASDEALELFRSAAASDARHVRSRYYLASEATRSGDYAGAVDIWSELLALAAGDEPWVAGARAGLAAAEAGTGGEAPPDAAAIAGMVDGLAERLAGEGGSIEEWTQLVRSRLVQGEVAAAQSAYDAARRAHPDPAERRDLDVLAADNGLLATEAGK